MVLATSVRFFRRAICQVRRGPRSLNVKPFAHFVTACFVSCIKKLALVDG